MTFAVNIWHISRNSMSGLRKVMKEYGLWIVAVPGIIGIHWCWFKLQQNELFVPREFRFNNPLVQRMESISNSITSFFSGDSGKTTSTNDSTSTK
ncbi:uncharacterized protein TNIN_4621 [Trichonephila inaurata madagascariensis]|uniref:Uncharacterized protein n=1 Tax=Trichonephila inaurata madagascariensis TaxID=2747483 RepID=A0A8X6X2W7_9ARAC|nr:uncharacterized protein TNIN_4621 [Trichonephila inaurata madagascariensis]